jgi:hypothetical protein
MSAFRPKADIVQHDGHVRFVPTAAVSRRSKNHVLIRSDRFVSEEKLDHNVLELRIIHSTAGSLRSQPGWAPRLEILCREN